MSDRYAVLGNPLRHTKSPIIHTAFARQTGEEIDYCAIEAPLAGFAASVETFRTSGGKGINVTAPFKLEALNVATRQMPRATEAGASNCLKFDGTEIIAENFDGVGLVRDILDNLKVPIKGKRLLLLGAGGAARGVVIPILDAGPALLTIQNRTRSKAVTLREAFADHGPIEVGPSEGAVATLHDIVINATSASLRAEMPEVGEYAIARGGLAYELAYGKGLTPFLQDAKARGAGMLADGVGMLVEQAAEAFRWWRGIRPNTSAVIGDLKIPLE